jgi:hypothetical protein
MRRFAMVSAEVVVSVLARRRRLYAAEGLHSPDPVTRLSEIQAVYGRFR